MFKRKSKSVEPDTRSFKIGDICKLDEDEERYIIQGIVQESSKVTLILGRLDTSNLDQVEVDSERVTVISLKLTIVLQEAQDEVPPPDDDDIDQILNFFGRTDHKSFKRAFKKFCKAFNVPYENARPLLISRVFSWDLHNMFEDNGTEWNIPRTGRMYIGRSVVDEFNTTLGPITLTYKPLVVSSEVAMLSHQRKTIKAAKDVLTSEQLSILKMTPPPSKRSKPKTTKAKRSDSKKKINQRNHSASSRVSEYDGFGMIDFQGDIKQVRHVVGRRQPVKLQVIPLGGRVIGAHKNQVTDINLLSHGYEALMKERRRGQSDEDDDQPVMTSEIDLLAKLSLVQVIPSTNRFNQQHLTDQLIPHTDQISEDAYDRMSMCILANEYLTDISLPLADVFEKDLTETFKKLVFSVMYSDLELRLEHAQDTGTHDRSTRGSEKTEFIIKVFEMNKLRATKSNEMKEPDLFHQLFSECLDTLPDDKDGIETGIREFFKKKLKDWKIHIIESLKPTRDEQPSLPEGSNTSYLKKSGSTASTAFPFKLNPMQQKKALKEFSKEPHGNSLQFARRPADYPRPPIQGGDKFISRDGVIHVVGVDDSSNVLVQFNDDERIQTMQMETFTDKTLYIPYPKQGTLYQSPNGGDPYSVIGVTSQNNIEIQDKNGQSEVISFEQLALSTIERDPDGWGMRHPTKKRRHKRRNTRKGG